MLSLRTLATILIAAAPAACSGSPDPAAPPPPRSASAAELAPAASAALYTTAQAERGRWVFRATCSECHYSSEMRGEDFQFEWSGRTVGDLLRSLVRTMPDDDPGSLEAQEYLDVVTYILRLNGFAAGDVELTADAPALRASLKAPSS